MWSARRSGPGLAVSDPEGWSAQAEGMRAVLCLAGVTPLAAARGSDYAEDTGLALAAMAAAEAAGAWCFLCSSAAVYGRAGGVLREEDAPRPVIPYGEAKARTEEAALARAAQTGQGVTLLRIGNVAGADAILGGWAPGFTLDSFADGTTPARSYIGPATLAHVLATLCGMEDLPQILNIASPGVVEMGALLAAGDLPYDTRPAPDTAIPRVEFSTERLTSRIPLPQATPDSIVAEWQADRRLQGTVG